MGKTKVEGIDVLLRNYMKEKRIRQSELAKLLNKSQTTISFWMNRVYFPRSTQEIDKLSEVLQRPVSYILDSIEVARTGIQREHEQKLIELNNLNMSDIKDRYVITLDGEELTEEEIKETLDFFRHKRFLDKKRDNNN